MSGPGACALWGAVVQPQALGISEEEARTREEIARAAGVQEGREQAKKEANGLVQAARAEIAAAMDRFQNDRESYFQRVESEVVRLSLSIARKILHRESQIDPTLLAGVVRLALGKYEEKTSVRLRVGRGPESAWRDVMSKAMAGAGHFEIIVDESLRPEQCVLETQMGFTDISLDAQLKEIELGFFDLLAQRPGTAP